MNVTENCIPAHNIHLACLINMLFAIAQARSAPRRRPHVQPQRRKADLLTPQGGHEDPSGTAEITTNAWASGPSSVTVTSMRASWPAGVIALRRSSAPPVSFIVGRPEGRLTTPMSRQNTPALSPVPSAFAHASLAAKRLA